MRNKAKPGRTGASGGQRVGGAYCAKQSQFSAWPVVQNKPNFRRQSPLGRGLGAWDEGNCAKQSQLTPEPREGQVIYRQRVMVYCTCTRLRQNKANLRRGREGRSGYEDDGLVRTNPISTQPSPRGRPIMRNKPNSAGSNVQNEPNLATADRLPGANRAKRSQLTGLAGARMLAVDEVESLFH